MRRVLVAVDGSECNGRALKYLIRELEQGGPAEVHVLHVQMPGPERLPNIATSEEYQRVRREGADAAIAEARDLLGRAAVGHKVQVETGDPAETIARFAKAHQCDEIVMGTRGLGAVKNLLLGSVASKVVHLADAPVMLVK